VPALPHSSGSFPLSSKNGRPKNKYNIEFEPFKSPYWMTFLQCKNLGGKVKAGEKSRIVIYWEKNTYEDESTGKLEKSILSKVYFVFNLDQTDGIPENKIPQILNTHTNPIEEAEAIIQNFPNKPEIQFRNEDKACYYPSRDLISIPAKDPLKIWKTITAHFIMNLATPQDTTPV
jgi:antirestriction protein ArdC